MVIANKHVAPRSCDFSRPQPRPHLVINLKAREIERARMLAIEHENSVLVGHVRRIAAGARDDAPTKPYV